MGHLCILFVVVHVPCAREMGYIFCIKNPFVGKNGAVYGHTERDSYVNKENP